MNEYADALKFWIRGSKENPAGVIETLSNRIGLPISAMDACFEDFGDPRLLWHPYKEEKDGSIGVRYVKIDSVYGQWLMAAWPEIIPGDKIQPKILTLVIKSKGGNIRCKDCMLYDYCRSCRRFNSLAALYPFPFTPCVQDVEVWDSEAAAKEHYGL